MAMVLSRRTLAVKAELTPGSVHAEFVVEKAAREQGFLPVLWFSPSNIIPA
jgi:hypothetical protein